MKIFSRRFLRGVTAGNLALSIVFTAAGAAHGEQSSTLDFLPALSIELNTLSQQDNACRLIFLVHNSMGKDLEKAVFETVLFKADGSVDRLTLFDFQKLPQGRPRVRQFDIPGLDCDALGRVLINDVHACSGDGITGTDCIDALKLSTKTTVEVLG